MRHTLLVFLIFIVHSAYGTKLQEKLAIQNLSINDGLPSNRINQMFQDSKGYIWFASSKGLCRYNGKTFEKFDRTKGLPDNRVSEVYEDEKGTIWFLSKSGRLSYLKKNKIYPYKYNDSIISFLKTNETPIKPGIVMQADTIWMNFCKSGLVKITPKGEISSQAVDSCMQVLSKDNQLLIGRPQNGFFNKIIFDGNCQKCIKLKTPHYCHAYIQKLDSTYVYGQSNKLIFFNNNGIKKDLLFPNKILWLNIDDKDVLWVSVQNNGIFKFERLPNYIEEAHRILPTENISTVLRDHEGGVWFSSFQNGVHYLPNENIKKIEIPSDWNTKNLIKIDFFHNDLHAFSKNGEILSLNKKDKHQRKLNYIRNIRSSQNHVLVSDGKSLIKINTKDHTQKKIVIDTIGLSHILYTDYESCLLYAKKMVYLVNIESQKIERQASVNDFIFDATKVGNEEFLLGGRNGIYRFFVKKNHIKKENYLQTEEINSLYYCHNEKANLIGTNGNGIFISSDKEIKHITEKEGLSDNSITKIKSYSGKYFVVSAKGIEVLSNNFKELKRLHLPASIIGSPIKDFVIHENVIHVLSNKGIYTHPVENLFNEVDSPPLIHLQSINDSIYTPQNSFSFNYNNPILLNLNYISFKEADQIFYQIDIDGKIKYAYESHSQQVKLSYLQPGDYTVNVIAISHATGLKSEPISFSIEIIGPYWKSWWFLIIISAVFSLVIWGVYLVRIKQMQARNDLKYKLDNYKQQALRQQMNPHFIFNTLNSIQYFILEEDSLNSHNYLTKFAKLMRLTLDNSQEPFIPIEEEVQALSLYLDLENLRFDNKFTYDIELDPKINLYEDKIPTLLIQPFVENAIWHGIMNKKEGGTIQIKLEKQEDDLILCSVEDDGIGRKAAGEIQKRKKGRKSSLGTKITSDRLQLLSSLYGKDIEIKYIDKEENDIAIGTRVEIFFPFE